MSWSRAGGFPLGRRSKIDGSKLLLEFVQKEDEGEYICTATNEIGYSEARAQLFVGRQPNGNNKSTYETGMFTLHTEPTLLQRPASDPFLTGKDYRTPQDHQTPRGDEKYKNTSFDLERGKFENCSTGKIKVEPSEQRIAQGSNATIKCLAKENTEVLWEKVREDLQSPNLFVSGNMIQVISASVSDRGMYVCTVVTSCGTERASSILEVEPREVPTVEMYPSNKVTVSKGESVLFQCRYLSGIPPPMISWSRSNGSPMPPNAELLAGGVLRFAFCFSIFCFF